MALYVNKIRINGVERDIEDVLSRKQLSPNLFADMIAGTRQVILFNDDGSLHQVVHRTIVSNTTIRTDTFSIGDERAIEIRTMDSGETLTITTNLQTLEIEVQYEENAA